MWFSHNDSDPGLRWEGGGGWTCLDGPCETTFPTHPLIFPYPVSKKPFHPLVFPLSAKKDSEPMWALFYGWYVKTPVLTQKWRACEAGLLDQVIFGYIACSQHGRWMEVGGHFWFVWWWWRARKRHRTRGNLVCILENLVIFHTPYSMCYILNWRMTGKDLVGQRSMFHYSVHVTDITVW